MSPSSRARCRTTSSRNTSRAAPMSSRRSPRSRLITDVAAYTREHLPKWNPMNVCSYHLQEAGATPEQELAFALATAITVLDDLRGKVPAEHFPEMVGRISFFVNAGIRFVTELSKMRAFVDLWEEITRERYGVDRAEVPPLPLRRAGQLARPYRAAAGKQRLPDPHRNARGHAVEKGPRPRRAASRLERGARPAAAVGPAMVAPDAADPRLRDRPARIRRHLRRQPGDRAQGRGAQSTARAPSLPRSTRWAARWRRSTT